MSILKRKIVDLQSKVDQLLHLGEDNQPIYADVLTQLNETVHKQLITLFSDVGKTPEEEASICVLLLRAYRSIMYSSPADNKRKQILLDRSWLVLEKLQSSLLKCQLLTYCYGETYEEELYQEAHRIIETWRNRDLTPEEQEIIETLSYFEKYPDPHWEVTH